MTGYVYVIRIGEFYKIGRTRSLKARLKELGTGSPHVPELVFKSLFYDCTRIEARLHRRFRKLRIRGEWFQLARRELVYLASYFRKQDRLCRDDELLAHEVMDKELQENAL